MGYPTKIFSFVGMDLRRLNPADLYSLPSLDPAFYMARFCPTVILLYFLFSVIDVVFTFLNCLTLNTPPDLNYCLSLCFDTDTV
jgi:hypothetical protein